MLDQGLTKMANLKILNVSHNFLKNLEPFLLRMNLQTLQLEGNPL